MENSKHKIINSLKKLKEGVVKPEDLKRNIEDLVSTTKDTLKVDDDEAKEFVSGIVGEDGETTMNEKYKSKAQQRFMGMVYHCKKTGDCPSASVKKVAKNMGTKDVEDLASTKHRGLPNKVEEDDYESISRSVEYGINPELDLEHGVSYYVSLISLDTDEIIKVLRQFDNRREASMFAKDYIKNNKIIDREDVDVMTQPSKIIDPEEYKEWFNSFEEKGFNENNDLPDFEKSGRAIQHGVSEPEVGSDNYEEYRQLLQQMIDGESGEQMKVEEENDPEELKTDVKKVLSKLDIASIAPYLKKIDNPVEQAEMIAQFAEIIGVPKSRLASVVTQLKTVAENVEPKITKSRLIEMVSGKKNRKIIKTIKVKDIK